MLIDKYKYHHKPLPFMLITSISRSASLPLKHDVLASWTSILDSAGRVDSRPAPSPRRDRLGPHDGRVAPRLGRVQQRVCRAHVHCASPVARRARANSSGAAVRPDGEAAAGRRSVRRPRVQPRVLFCAARVAVPRLQRHERRTAARVHLVPHAQPRNTRAAGAHAGIIPHIRPIRLGNYYSNL